MYVENVLRNNTQVVQLQRELEDLMRERAIHVQAVAQAVSVNENLLTSPARAIPPQPPTTHAIEHSNGGYQLSLLRSSCTSC